MSSAPTLPRLTEAQIKELQTAPLSDIDKLRKCIANKEVATLLQAKASKKLIGESFAFLRAMGDYVLLEYGLSAQFYGTSSFYSGTIPEATRSQGSNAIGRWIYERFISEKGDDQVNIDGPARLAIAQVYAKGSLEPSTFADARLTIERLVTRDAEPRLLIQEHYKEHFEKSK